MVVLWMHIRSGWTQFERFIRFDARNGTQTRFWLDVWQGKTTLRLPSRGDIPLCFMLQEIDAGVAYHVEIRNDKCYWTPMFLCST